MADIFLSYTETDRDVARRIADTLAAAGWSIWWDRRIPAGETWRGVLDEALQEMRCMVVLWSARSIASEWVYEEASEGRRLGKLVPVMLEAVRPPAGFREIQAADLTGWDGTREFDGMRLLIADLERLLGKPVLTPDKQVVIDPVVKPANAELPHVPSDLQPRQEAEKQFILHGKFPWVLGAMLLSGAAYLGLRSTDPAVVAPPAPIPVRPDQVLPPLATIPEPPKSASQPERHELSILGNQATASVPAVKASPAEQLTPVKKPVKAYLSARCSDLLSRQQLGESFSAETKARFDRECNK